MVTDDADIFVRARKELGEFILYGIGVLIFIDVYVRPAVLIVCEDIGMVFQKRERFEEQIVEVKRFFLRERAFVAFPDGHGHFFKRIFCFLAKLRERHGLPFLF
jgi:predicted RND superfamily exporter protein